MKSQLTLASIRLHRLMPMWLLATLALTGGLQGVHAREGSGQAQDAGLFASDQPLEITIRAAWRTIVRDKANQRPYPATISYVHESGETHTLPLAVARRGISRQRICSFPPIKLQFAGKAANGSAFEGEKSIKMVTHCKKGARWEQYYVKEFLAYRIYNVVTDRSFRVRPLTVRYVGSDPGDGDTRNFAFLIEDDAAVAERNGLKKIKLARIAPSQLDPLESSRFALFQYLIGNTDWEVLSGPSKHKCCHNSVLMGADARTGINAVPYDFDSSGLVNASYAAPPEILPIERVTERLYRGLCIHNPALAQARREYLDKEQQILDVVRNEGRLSPRNKEVALRYLGEFFDVMRSERRFATEITGKCRK